MIADDCRLILFISGLIFFCHTPAHSDMLHGQKSATPFTITNDCTNVEVEFVDNPSMTDQERLEAMDQAFMRSLNRFDACQHQLLNRASSASGAMSGGSAAGSSQTISSESGETGNVEEIAKGNDMSGGTVNSIPSSDMMGTESKQSSELNPGSDEEGGNRSTAQMETKAKTADGREASKPSGKNENVPEDIPSADNDSVLEAQIREAAMNEKDPEIRDRLWNEYRRYKKLPPK